MMIFCTCRKSAKWGECSGYIEKSGSAVLVEDKENENVIRFKAPTENYRKLLILPGCKVVCCPNIDEKKGGPGYLSQTNST
jgi:hypothetical protein